ncbi:MAG: bifunctional ADP-dependent NAD(P)H-hydrate dehydratase/NAD(P)H-hydrate epimerase [Alphaproteobacteria bacterium HGW-Alphaproteobacteria-18]|nr:MAG: bifunctional ADP-dependent NAD(P)H-hydrate dehydratase/NAD(P)H-hydrate epimerase [Alphaproteobacteria bacterium HGW-Alphaproteobacteria-18]
MGRPILTPQEMLAAEQAVIDTGTERFTLMHRAGEAVAEFVHTHWPDGSIQVLCGPGGNGGDGFIAAAKLAKFWRKVEVFCTHPVSELTGDTARAASEWDGPVHKLEDALNSQPDLVLDALYGAGLTRPLEGPAAMLALRGGRVISVDVPSGIDGYTGKPLGPAFQAEATITFAALRPAHVLLPGSAFSGPVMVADIGVPLQTALAENSPALWHSQMPQPGFGVHKYQRGHLKVVSGGPWNTGAARLTAKAGLRAGAGLVTMLSPPDAAGVHAAHLTAIMLAPFVTPDDLAAYAARSTAMVIGPAAGVTDATRANVEALLKGPARLLLDADALTVFGEDPDALFKQLRPTDILTPHDGEFARLFGDLLATSDNKVQAARAAAAKAGCVILLKGADTVIAQPDGNALVNTHATRWLATAGSGDVLAGIIAGFMAQGVDTFVAAAIGCWLHGEAGRRVGAGLIAEDIEMQLPFILSALHGELG